MAKGYTAEQVADMIMNDDIEKMDSADSLDEESSSSSSNDEPLLNAKLIVAAILTLSFMIDKSLWKNILLETVPQSMPKQEQGSQTMVELSEQEEAFQTMVKLSEQEEASHRDAAHTSHLQLNEIMDNHPFNLVN